MKSWPTKPLGDFVARKSGSVVPSKFPDESFDLYSIPAFDSGEPEVRTGNEIGSAKQIVATNDVLLSRIVPHIRRAWVVGANRGRRLIGSGEWIVFRSPQIHPQFLRYFLIGNPFHARFMRTVSGVGGSLLRAKVAEVAKIEFPVPALTEQRRIVSLLDDADKMWKLRAQADRLVSALIPALFHEMFGDPAENLKDFPIRSLPDIAFFQEGPGVRKWQFRSSGIKLINVGNIVEGHIDLSRTERHLDKAEVEKSYTHFLLKAGDLVMATSGATWGKVAFVEAHHLPLCMNTSVVRFRPLSPDTCDSTFLRGFFESKAFRRQIEQLITGSAQPNFGPSHLKQVRVPLPPISLQREFAQQVTEIRELESSQATSRTRLDALFQSMLHRAFNGEL